MHESRSHFVSLSCLAVVSNMFYLPFFHSITQILFNYPISKPWVFRRQGFRVLSGLLHCLFNLKTFIFYCDPPIVFCCIAHNHKTQYSEIAVSCLSQLMSQQLVVSRSWLVRLVVGKERLTSYLRLESRRLPLCQLMNLLTTSQTHPCGYIKLGSWLGENSKKGSLTCWC